MKEIKNILILYDTNLFEVDADFSRWVLDFKNNISEVLNRSSVSSIQFFLIQDIALSSEQPAVIQPGDFNAYIVLLADELDRSKNLKRQFEQIFNLSGDTVENPAGKKILYIMLWEFPIDYFMMQIPDKKIIKFYKQSNVSVYIPRNMLTPQDRDYWLKLMEILDFLSWQTEENVRDFQLIKNQVIAYVGLGSPDIADKRDRLISDMKKRGIQVIPERIVIPEKLTDTENIVDLLEYSDLIVQIIGGEYGKIADDSQISFQEQEFDIISKYLAGEIPDNLIISKPHPRVIWIPEDIIVSDRRQEEFINKIKRQIWYMKEDTEIITGSFEKLKEYVFSSLNTRIVHRVKEVAKKEQHVIYIIHEKSVLKQAQSLMESLRPYQFSLILTHDLIVHKNFIRAHKETLNRCDGVIIFYGFDNAYWYESTIKEVIKANQLKRERPFKFKIVVCRKNLLEGLQRYNDFIYVDKEKLTDLKIFHDQLNKTIG